MSHSQCMVHAATSWANMENRGTEEGGGSAPSSWAAVIAQLELELTCSLCGDMFDNPQTLPTCGHVFCKECIIDTLEGPGISTSQCPKCGQPVWKNELTHNTKYTNLVAAVKSLRQLCLGYREAPPQLTVSPPKAQATPVIDHQPSPVSGASCPRAAASDMSIVQSSGQFPPSSGRPQPQPEEAVTTASVSDGRPPDLSQAAPASTATSPGERAPLHGHSSPQAIPNFSPLPQSASAHMFTPKRETEADRGFLSPQCPVPMQTAATHMCESAHAVPPATVRRNCPSWWQKFVSGPHSTTKPASAHTPEVVGNALGAAPKCTATHSPLLLHPTEPGNPPSCANVGPHGAQRGQHGDGLRSPEGFPVWSADSGGYAGRDAPVPCLASAPRPPRTATCGRPYSRLHLCKSNPEAPISRTELPALQPVIEPAAPLHEHTAHMGLTHAPFRFSPSSIPCNQPDQQHKDLSDHIERSCSGCTSMGTGGSAPRDSAEAAVADEHISDSESSDLEYVPDSQAPVGDHNGCGKENTPSPWLAPPRVFTGAQGTVQAADQLEFHRTAHCSNVPSTAVSHPARDPKMPSKGHSLVQLQLSHVPQV